MSEKKLVGRNIAIASGIICIILAVGLVGVVVNYTSIISEKDNTLASLTTQKTTLQNQLVSNQTLISSLKPQITNLQNQISSLDSQLLGNKTLINSLNSQITILQNQVNSLNANMTLLQNQIIELTQINGSQVWINKTYVVFAYTSYVSFSGFSTPHIGNVSVTVSNDINTGGHATVTLYIDLIYGSTLGSSGEISIAPYTNGTLVLPVSPSSSVQIKIGGSGGLYDYEYAYLTITATYYY